MKKSLIIIGLISSLFATQVQAGATAGTFSTFNIFHPIKSIRNDLIILAAANAGFVYLLTHPEKLDSWLSTHPNEVPALTNYVDKKINTAKTQEDLDKYVNFKNKLALGVSQSQATDLEQEQDWQTIKLDVESAITNTDAILIQNNQMPQQCDINVVKQLLLPYKQFEATINQALPKIQQQPTQILNVNTYKNLVDGYKTANKTIPQNQDHIPSYAAMEMYLNNHGITIKYFGVAGKRDSDVQKNETAISVPEDIHKLGRTYVGRNTKIQINNDANDLLIATIKDITTTAYRFYQNPQYNITVDDYIQSAMYIYARNKMLCLYDVK